MWNTRHWAPRCLAIPALLVAVLAVAVIPARAAVVTWSGTSLSGTGSSLIDTTEKLHFAQNNGGVNAAANTTITAGGVTFQSAGSHTIPLGSGFGVIGSGANPGNITGNSNFDDLLDTASFGTSTLTLAGLDSGKPYRVQLFATDSRGCCSGRTVTVDDGLGNTHTSTGIGSGYVFKGTFTASGATQNIDISGSGPGYLNAYQVREVQPGTILQPTSVSSSGLGTSNGTSFDNLINGNGLSNTPTAENVFTTTHTNESFVAGNLWVNAGATSDPPSASQITFELPFIPVNELLDTVHIWQYGQDTCCSGRGLGELQLSVSSDGISFTPVDTLSLNRRQDPALGTEPVQSFSFAPQWGATHVRFDNIKLLTTGANHSLGLSEVRFASHVVPEPATLLIWSLLAGLGIGLGRRRRR